MNNERVKLYRFVEPVDPHPPVNTELFRYEYRSFMITRANNEYLHWIIQNMDGSPLPKELISYFLTRQMAENTIDDFLEIEAIKQEKANNK